MKAANFDKAFNAKDEATLNAYADRIRECLIAMGRTDLTFKILFGDDPFAEYPDFINNPNGFQVLQNDELVFEIYTPTEKNLDADCSESFSYAKTNGEEAEEWGKMVSDNDVEELAEHLNAELPVAK